MTLNLKINESSILTGYNDVIHNSNCDNWLILEYEGNSNIIKVGDQGDGGIEEMVTNFNSGKLQYGIGAVPASATSQPKIILIQWQGDGVPSARLAVTARHVNDLKRVLRGIHTVIIARSEDDIDLASIQKVVSKLAGVQESKFSEGGEFVEPKPVGSVYQPIKPNKDINLSERDSFWKVVEAEEADRLKEEKRRTDERNAAVNKEREELNQQLHAKFQIDTQKEQLKKTESGSGSFTSRTNTENGTGLIKGRKMLFEQKANELRESQTSVLQKKQLAGISKSHLPQSVVPVPSQITSVKRESSVLSTPSQGPEINVADSNQGYRYLSESAGLEPTPSASRCALEISSNVSPPSPPFTTSDSVPEVPEPPLLSPEYLQAEPETYISPYYKKLSSEKLNSVASPNNDTGIPSYYEEPPVEEPTTGAAERSNGTSLRAVALWDYQAADDTEITFDPNDIITEIDQIDEGWWRGRGPDGRIGLFPANYVSLLPQ